MSKHNPRLDELHQVMAAHPKKMPLNDRGQLVPDPIPMAPPIGYKAQPSMVEIIRAQVLQVSKEAARQGLETEEEADDFDVGDDVEPSSPYEMDAQSEVPLRVLKARADEATLDYLEAKRDAGLRMQADAAAPKPSSSQSKSAEKEGEAAGVTNNPPAPPSGR